MICRSALVIGKKVMIMKIIEIKIILRPAKSENSICCLYFDICDHDSDANADYDTMKFSDNC